MISKYHNRPLQNNPRHPDEEPQNNNYHMIPERLKRKLIYKDIEQMRKSNIYLGPYLCYKFAKMIYNISNLDLNYINALTNLVPIVSICSQDIERERNSDTRLL